MYDRILVPIDEGVVSTDAIGEATRLAQGGGKIHGLYVKYQTAQRESEGFSQEDSRLDELEKAAEDAGIPTVLETRVGTPAESICGYAEENDIDIIVMGTHAREGISNILFGSVTEDTIHKAPCPVLAVPHHVVEE